MENKNYWKNAYKEFWDKASNKEKAVKELIKGRTGLQVLEVGLGAGSSEFMEGNAKDHQLSKGDADLYIPEKDCYVEITGPNIPMRIDEPLWIRPDKLKNTYQKLRNNEGKWHVVFHVLTEKNTHSIKIRVVSLDETFFELVKNHTFKLVHPHIRGRKEKYAELPPTHPVIITLEQFIEKLASL